MLLLAVSQETEAGSWELGAGSWELGSREPCLDAV